MSRPGVNVSSSATPPPRGISTNTGTCFWVGTAEKGPLTSSQLVRNLDEFKHYYVNSASRQSMAPSTSLLYDCAETAFREGVTSIYIARVAGPSAVTATRTLSDASSGTSLSIAAKNPGVWGNSLSVAVTSPGSGQYQLVITHSTLGQVDVSPVLSDQASAVNWSRFSDWVNVSIPGGASALIPAVAGASALSSGADDYSGITDTLRQTALTLFGRDLGPGQVSIPGNTTSGNRTALIAHARANNREAILDASDTPSRSSLVTEGAGLQTDEYGSLFAPWIVIPGVVAGSTRTVPPCAYVAGLIARSDAVKSPNEPAAGSNGVARFALDVSQPAWNDADRTLLNSAGVNVIRQFYGAPTLYGFRTLANPNGDTSWIGLGNQRLRLAITRDAEAIAEGFDFDQLDGHNLTISEFGGALAGMLKRYYLAGALYGNTPSEAYNVNVGDSVNTATTIANNELHAVLTLRMSPFAEEVDIAIAKVPVTQQI